jgi:peptide-methionine (R)-S-oxide reductase
MKHLYKILFLYLLVVVLAESHFSQTQNRSKTDGRKGEAELMKELKSEKDWKNLLSPQEYHVLREKGTERAFTGRYWNFFEKGIYKCAACGQILFDSETKFDAGCGWPSFSDAVSNKNLLLKDDFSFGIHRIEVMCSNCGGHLGHVFDDGPKPKGKRYCINSVSIKFENDKNSK